MFGLEADLELLRRMSVALLIGALVGVERERQETRSLFGGVRTFILIAEAGAVSAWMAGVLSAPYLIAAGCVAVVGLLLASRAQSTGPGLTSEIAAIVVFFLGAATVLGNELLAVSLGIVTTALLTFKTGLHQLAGLIDRDDLVAGLKLLFATFIVLPLLPDAPVDPWEVLNPYKLWWLVILISSLSLIGYTAVRWLGEQRGLALTGFFGGLVSSTAVTLSFARQSRVTPSADMLTVGILLAWTIMFFRVIVEVAVVHAPLLRAVAPLMALLGACCLLVTGVLYWRSRARAVEDSPTVALTNPFSLWEAIKFGLFFAGVLLLVELSQRYLPASMIYGVAALAGTTDVDAITLSLAEEVRAGALEDTVAAQAIIIAALSNTLVKCGMVVALGSRPLGVRVSIASGVMVVAGVLALWVQAGL